MREITIQVSAGHNIKDPGAINKKGVKEHDLAVILRDYMLERFEEKEVEVIHDKDDESNSVYQNRLRQNIISKTNITFDIHFNSGPDSANGTETFVSRYASKESIRFAEGINKITVDILGTKDRGVKDETKTYLGKIGILGLKGVAALVEVCFISNDCDMDKFYGKEKEKAYSWADFIMIFDNDINNEK